MALEQRTEVEKDPHEALTYRLDEWFNTVISPMQTTAKATTHRVPDIIKNRVALIMEHRCHFLPLRGHHWSWAVSRQISSLLM